MKIVLGICSLFSYVYTISCPKYQCVNTTDNICASVKSGINTIGYNHVNLTAICEDGQRCGVDFPQYYWLAAYSEDHTFKCVDNNSTFMKKLPRYPGEDCYTDQDCIGDTKDKIVGKCVHRKCYGHDINEKCHSHTSCLQGLYCDRTNNTCQKQKDRGSRCISSYECFNQYLCHEHTCSISPYSLPLGTKLSDNDEFYAGFKCIFGIAINNTCTSFNQTRSVNNYIPCDMTQSCNYTTNEGEPFTTACDCGYNSDGQGYCRLGHNICKRRYLNIRGE
jgi:hypothetical protein